MSRPVKGSVELYKLGLKMENDPSTTEEEWEEYWEEMRRANIAYAFKSKRKDSIWVVEDNDEE